MRRFGMEWEVDIHRNRALDIVADVVPELVRGPRRCRPNRDGSQFMAWSVGGWQVGGDPSLLRDRVPVERCTEISTAPLTDDDLWPVVLRNLEAIREVLDHCRDLVAQVLA